MSLINEALKKAQRNRDPHPSVAGPGASDPLPGPPIYAKPRSQFAHPMLVALATVGVCALLAGGAYVWVNRSVPVGSTEVPPPVTPVVSVAPATAPVETERSSVAPAARVTSPEPMVSVGSGLAAASASSNGAPVTVAGSSVPSSPAPAGASSTPAVITVAPAPAASVSQPVVTPAPLVAAADPAPRPAPSSQPPAPAVPTENPAVINFIERLRITGVRASASDPKVLMNDRVYRQQDIVDRDLNLRLVRIEPHTLTFTDESGYVYTKSF